MINRRNFTSIAVGTTLTLGTTSYLLSDKRNLVRADVEPIGDNGVTLKPDEKEILFLAPLRRAVTTHSRGLFNISNPITGLLAAIAPSKS
ncbi:MAG: hypothetical protein WA949_12970 [Phormidesmis sp.]